MPVALHSGRHRWRASLDFAGLLGDIPADLQPYQPQMRYLLVHEGDLLQAAGLPQRNLATLLFRLQRSRDIESALKYP